MKLRTIRICPGAGRGHACGTAHSPGKKFTVSSGTNLLRAFVRQGIALPASCGGRGICGSCAVDISPAGRRRWQRVLACRHEISSDLTVRLIQPAEEKPRILRESAARFASGKAESAGFLRRRRFASKLELILDHDELLAVERQNKEHVFGLAVDAGTTTVCVSVCNLENGAEAASAAVMNAQAEYGRDLISRIQFARLSRDNPRLLKEKITASINQAIDECARKSGVRRRRIFTAVVAGNAVMHHLLLGLSVRTFIQPPYGAVSRGLMLLRARELGLDINPNATVRVLAPVGGFVGADAAASILALRLYRGRRISLCVDLGTNGELILNTPQGLAAASTAAGPAFEGGNISCGMIARPGAVEWIRLDAGRPVFQTIGHVRPLGICGSGIIDLTGELLKAGIIDAAGRMEQKSFVVYSDKHTRIEFTRRDVRQVQLAKAAVNAGIRLLLDKFRIGAGQVKDVFLAGAFGSYLDREQACRIGLVPEEFRDKIKVAGNTAFAGAKSVLLSRRELRRAVELSRSVRHVSLAREKKFQDEFIRAMNFPAPPR